MVLIYNVTRFVSKNCNMSVLIIVIYCDICVILDAFNFYCSYIDVCVSLCVVNLEHTRVK